MNRIEEGYCCVINPFNTGQVSCVSLKPDDVDIIVFWTKDAVPMIEHTDTLDRKGFSYYFQYTVNGYPPELEPNLPSLDSSIGTFKRLVSKIGPEKVIWRYDPILVSDLTPVEYHIKQFYKIADGLRGNTGRVVVSIVDGYRAAKGRLKRADIGYDPDLTGRHGFADMMTIIAQIAADAGLEIYSCAEVIDLQPFGIQPGKCIDDEYIRSVFGIDVTAKKDKTQRAECGCVTSKDIGQYDTCLHGCQYCYATRSATLSVSNAAQHFPDSPSLIGRHICQPDDKSGQQTLF